MLNWFAAEKWSLSDRKFKILKIHHNFRRWKFRESAWADAPMIQMLCTIATYLYRSGNTFLSQSHARKRPMVLSYRWTKQSLHTSLDLRMDKSTRRNTWIKQNLFAPLTVYRSRFTSGLKMALNAKAVRGRFSNFLELLSKMWQSICVWQGTVPEQKNSTSSLQ